MGPKTKSNSLIIIMWVIICFLTVETCGIRVDAKETGMVMVNVGVVIDPKTQIGKEQRVGMEIAAEDYNNNSSDNVTFSLYFGNSNTSDPFQTALSAQQLVLENKVTAIVGAETWEEAALLGEIGNQYSVPILSLAAPLPSLSSATHQPFLVQMASNYTAQIECIGAMVSYYGWKRVVVVYEDGAYDGSISSALDLLSQTLQDVGSEIEYRLAFPPLAFMANPKLMITEELAKVLFTQSRVFVVLYASIPLASYIFEEANAMGLMGRETAWIITDSIAGLLDSLNSTAISDMEGTLGIKRYYDKYTQNYEAFGRKFLVKLLQQYPEEVASLQQPSIHALRAYDAITTIKKAYEEVMKKEPISETTLQQGILTSNFTGLSGEIIIRNGVSEKDGSMFRIVNVVGKTYKELDFWSLGANFFEKLHSQAKLSDTSAIHGLVTWPGNIQQVPRGWAMPTDTKPLKIGVPGRTSFDKFVKVEFLGSPNRATYSGFCIDIFLEVVKIIEQSYALPYEFEAFYGTYDQLVDHVRDKRFDAVVGDVTILANREKHVDFTQPFMKSGLSMVVPFKSKEYRKARMFVKPFSWQLWAATLGTLIYTMLIIWLVERLNTNNSDFGGSCTNQLSDALWFTFSSIFFAHRENVQSVYTRAIVVVWLFIVFVLTQSYTASLTSTLTVPLLEPKLKNVSQVLENNSVVACDGDSFVLEYLVNVLGFRRGNIMTINSEYLYPEFFANTSIAAAFLELPYEKVFLNQYCTSYTRTNGTFRSFAGQGFVFQKGSPLVADVSRAILQLSENGVLKQLNDKWFTVSPICSGSSNIQDVERLKPEVFAALYVIHGIICTLCLLFFVAPRIRNYIRNYRNSTITLGHKSLWNRMAELAAYIHRRDAVLVENSTEASNGIAIDTTQRDDSVLIVQNRRIHRDQIGHRTLPNHVFTS